MEIEIFHVPKFAAGRRKQLLDHLDVIIHRTANIKKHQQLDRIAPLRAGLDVEPAMFRSGLDRARQIEFLSRPGAAPAALRAAA